MLHPVFRVLMRRPELVLDHVAGYADLLREQAHEAGGQLVSRALAWAVAVLGFVSFLVLAGVSAMLHAVLGHTHWVLWLVPGGALAVTSVAFLQTRQALPPVALDALRAQFDDDAQALRGASGP